MILVTGANGRVGRLVVRELAKLGEKPRVMVRDTQTATERFGDTAEVVAGDLTDPASIAAAMDGATSVFLCSPVDPDQVTTHGNVVKAATAAGAHVVKMSGLATFPGSYVDSGRWHAETESQIEASGLTYTFLHPYFFMQNLAFQIGAARDKGIIASGVTEAPITMVDVRDIAAVTARVLADPGVAINERLPLTTSTPVTFQDIATILTDLLERPVTFKAQSSDEIAENLRKGNMPEWHINIIVNFNRAFNEGLASEPHPAVKEILGREPIDVRSCLETLISGETSDSNPFPS